MDQQTDIFIIAGEPSGDMIAANLIRALKKERPELHVAGLGGPQMEAAGAEILIDMLKDFAIIGIIEVIAKYPQLRKLFYGTLEEIKQRRPKVVVFVDYPGFNLRMAKEINKLAEDVHLLGIKVVYYVIPQIWAWHKSRIHQIRQFVDKALVIFPFEEKLLQNAGIEAAYVGHPLLDVMVLTMDRAKVFAHFNFDPEKRLIGLLPGSRRREIDSLLPVMLEAAERIQAERPDVQFVIPRAPSVRLEQLDRHLRNWPAVKVHIVDTFRYNVRAAMDFALVASGTATLETGLLTTPMIILYRVAYPTWLIGKFLVNLPYVGLINIVAGDLVVPELLQDQCTGQNVADRTLQICWNEKEVERVRYQLGQVKAKMGGPGAAKKAAKEVLAIVDVVATRRKEN